VNSDGHLIFEFWLNSGSSPDDGVAFRSIDKTFLAHDGAGAVTFADFDADGNMDLLFPVCLPARTCSVENSIHIFYNQVSS
jgi:hypothetical protein